MAATGYLIRVEFKRQLGSSAEASKTCFVVPPTEYRGSSAESAEKAFALVAEAIHEASRYPIMEEIIQRRVSVVDLRPFRNSILLEKDGWRCFNAG